MVEFKEVKFTYSQEEKYALDGICAKIEKGEFVSVLGRNGSGKSTLARIMNALLLPTEGVCIVSGMDTSDENHQWDIRKICGMVFQNPDNQIIGTSVEEDVAFGLENIGISTAEIRRRIDDSMKNVGIYDKREKEPHLLSGGQKQRVAIAGILAMRPECIVLDEATAMLDPIGRKEVMDVVKKLNQDFNITIVHITHNMDEAVMADRVIVLDGGKIVMSGTPKEVFSHVKEIKALGLDVPQVTEFMHELIARGIKLPENILTVDEAVTCLEPFLLKAKEDRNG